MKKNMMMIVASCLVLSAGAFAADAVKDAAKGQDKEGTHGGAAQEMKNDHSPKEICMDLVMAAKKNNFKTIRKNTFLGDSMNNDTAAKDFHVAHEQHMAEMKDMSCGVENITGDHATVEASNKQGKRMIPFIQKNGQWKFDAPAYMSQYHVNMKGQS